MTSPSLAINNLRTFAVMLVLAVHASAAYLGSSPALPFNFDDPPFRWRALPIIDSDRFYAFDIFCAHQDTYLIALLFFVSGLFVWPSLVRKGVRAFLRDRILRIGIPFALTVGILMPIAHYPVYRVTAVDPGITAYWHHLVALPLWPSGPPWFLWVLLMFDLVAAVLFRFARPVGDGLGRAAGWLGNRPRTFVSALIAASVVAYVPLALAFTPWAWVQAGPFAFQLCRPLLYALWFFAGIGIGIHGIEHGLLAPSGWLAKRWRATGWMALATFALWITCAGIASMKTSPATRALEILSFAPACAASCLFMLSAFVHFANARSTVLDRLGPKAYGMYLVHYLPSVWLQFLLLGSWTPVFAGLGAGTVATILGTAVGTVAAAVKMSIVFCGTATVSYGLVAALQRIVMIARPHGKATASSR